MPCSRHGRAGPPKVLHFQDVETRAIVRSVDEALANVNAPCLRRPAGVTHRNELPVALSLAQQRSAQGGIEILLADKRRAPSNPPHSRGVPLDQIRPGWSGFAFHPREHG